MSAVNRAERAIRQYDIGIIRPQLRIEDFHMRSVPRAERRAVKKALHTFHSFEAMAANMYRFQIDDYPSELNRQRIAALCNELTHLQDFTVKLYECGWKPSKWRWVFWMVGMTIGYGSRLLGSKATLRVGVWAETRAVNHYAELLRDIPWDDETRRVIEKNQADEYGHVERWTKLLKGRGVTA